MFVSVVLDPGGIDSARLLVSVLIHAGFKKIQRACWESMSVTEADLTSLKKEIDRVTDYYDTVRIYQFPLNGMFVITELKQKRWKRCQMRSESESAQTPVASAAAARRAVRPKTAGVARQSAQTARSTVHAPRSSMHKQ